MGKRSEKYIIERFSNKRDSKGKISSYTVYVPFKKDGITTHYNKVFSVRDYVKPSDAKKAAIAERDRVLTILRTENVIDVGKHCTVDELWKEVPVHFPVTIGSQTKNNKVYKKHIQPLYGSKDIRDITQLDVQQTLNHVATYCVQQTVRNVKTDWHRIFQVAQINKIAVMDLTTLVKTPEAMKTTERSVKEENITAEDFDSFISFMNEYGGYLPNETERIYNRTILVYLMKVMRVSGIRLQEARALSRNDITIEEETGHNSENDQENIQEYALIHIRHSAGTTYDNDNAIRKTKTKWSVRSVPVFDEGLIWIKEVLEYTKHELIFAKYSGEPFTSSEVSDYVRRVCKKWKKVCGKDIDFYTTLMRKAYASDLYRDKVNQAAVKKLMGHKFESTSINWYAKSDDEEIKEAAKKRTYKKNK